MTQKYFETTSDLQAAQVREWMGREFGRYLGASAYPVPPDTWPGMNNSPPAPPPPGDFTWYYLDALPKVGGGGVFILDDDVIGFATQAQTLTDGHSFSVDLTNDSKTYAQLSAAGKAAVPTP